MIFVEGDFGREFLVLVQGRVQVEKDGQQLAVLSSGQWVGEISLLKRTPRTATVRTIDTDIIYI